VTNATDDRTGSCDVLLTFDVDGQSGTLRRNPELAGQPSLISMGEFGPNVGVPRILALLKAHALPATFFIPGWVAERHEERVREIAAQGHEIAHHGYMHEPPATLGPDEDEAELLDRASAILERITGSRPLGYRSPSWELSDRTLDLLAERGFVYDSSLMGNDVPYSVGTPTGPLVELPVHWSLDDVPYNSWSPAAGRTSTLSSPKVVYDAWEWEFEGAYRHCGTLMLTMHPHTTGRHGRMVALERLIEHIKPHSGVRFIRCIDLAREWRASELRSLEVESQ
jgi:peptidoglycan/xylan/chitin deacetylase (PgdA/CDA1 family)